MRILFFTVFFLVASAVIVATHIYIWRRLVRDTGVTGAWRRAAKAAIVAAAISMPLTVGLARALPATWVGIPSLVAYSWMGAVLYLVLLLGVADVIRLVVKHAARLRRPATPSPDASPEPPDEPKNEPEPEERGTPPTRRHFLARGVAGFATMGAAGVVLAGTRSALGDIETPEIEVALPRLPPALSGLRVTQLTDLHVHPTRHRRFVEEVVEKVRSMRPDFCVITGDLADGDPCLLRRDVAPLASIGARLGTYFVTGNHEYFSKPVEWCALLEEMGIRVLSNECVSVGDRGASIDLAGIPDPTASRLLPGHGPDLARALDGRDPERALVLLAHRPDPIHEAAEHGVGLQISGHTHGGQMWPVTFISRFVHPYVEGLHRHSKDTWIYVSRGAGFWGPPVRILAPSEIPTFVLVS